MKNINTLIYDIQSLVKTNGWMTDDLSKQFANEVSTRLKEQYEERQAPRLRLSALGPRCPKALWSSIHTPELAEPFPPWAQIKFSLGNIVEALAISLAKAAGHEVAGEQDELALDDVLGHRDCVIDGCTVDVKSAASPSFKRFKTGTFTDTFGYLEQLDGYVLASKSDPLVTVKDKGYLLLVDKQLGHMHLHEHRVTYEREKILRERISYYRSILALPNAPNCECGTIAQGTTGNIQLDLKASYSPYKYCCFPDLRTAIYSDGPVYFTKVIKWPRNAQGPIKEIDKEGKIVYN